jgi:hypothetical protein
MKTRDVTLASGAKYSVPQGIQRLDSGSTRGWQVRYGGTKYFADGTAGPKKSFDAAIRELLRRIATLPAPVQLKTTRSPGKTSDLPVGISGPNVLNKGSGKQQVAVLSVALPRFGSTPETRDVHIGTPATYSEQRYRDALAKALELREHGVREYERAATEAMRAQAKALKKALVATR